MAASQMTLSTSAALQPRRDIFANRMLFHARALLCRLSHHTALDEPEDPFVFQQQLIDELQAMSRHLTNEGYSEAECDGWRYMLCCALDEAIMSRSWSAPSPWPQMSLLLYFYLEGQGGARIYQRIDEWLRQPAPPHDLLQGIHLCLCLGYEGRYRIEPGGARTHLQWREQLSRTLYGGRQFQPQAPSVLHLMPQPQARQPDRQSGSGGWIWLLLFTAALYLFYQTQLNELAAAWLL